MHENKYNEQTRKKKMQREEKKRNYSLAVIKVVCIFGVIKTITMIFMSTVIPRENMPTEDFKRGNLNIRFRYNYWEKMISGDAIESCKQAFPL